VNFDLLDHQEQLLIAADHWLERHWADQDRASADYRRDLWSTCRDNGWCHMVQAPGEAGTERESATTGGLALVDAALLVEKLAESGVSLPLGPLGLIAPMLAQSIDDLRPLDAERIYSGELALAPLVRWPWSATAIPGADIDVSRSLPYADMALRVGAGGRERVSIEIFPTETAPVESSDGWFDLARWPTPSPDSTMQFDLDRAQYERVYLAGSILSAIELVGLATGVLNICVAYAKVRVQGGKPIGAHQALQHRMADMLGYIDRCRYLTLYAANAWDEGNGEPTADRAAHQAKFLAGRDCLTAIRSAHQILGAIGYSEEHDLHCFHKLAIVAANEWGSTNEHLNALSGGRASVATDAHWPPWD
jgi:alkylation response protein AidB-like acyl-CoA dehydrogenase